MHWIMGKSLFNTFCMMRELNLFHILLDISTWQTWQPSVLMLTRYKAALDEQQGNHHEITWSKKHQTVSPLEAAWSACFQLQATSFSDLGSQQIQTTQFRCRCPPLWHLNFLAAVWTVEGWWWVTLKAEIGRCEQGEGLPGSLMFHDFPWNHSSSDL